jgi:hypothetical protein
MDKHLQTKLKQLKLGVDRTKSILDSGKPESIKRHLNALRETVREANEHKRTVEAAKIWAEESAENINEWNLAIEGQIEQGDVEINRLEQWLSEKKLSEKQLAQEEQFRAELNLHEKRLKMKAELELSRTKPEMQECSDFKTAKLPKLVISKFDGTFMDWPRFWGQFSEAIDKSSIAPITKLTYLRELLDPKVKRCVKTLPFTTEGYNRAKSVLLDRYGKESEIVNSYVREILELPYIPSANPRKIAEFSEKLSYCVQALDTMKKLEQVRGNVAMTLGKLVAIRGDLVRTDPDWESWDFAKLSEAVRQWVKRNPATSNEKDRDERKSVFHAREDEVRVRGCVYCEDAGHKATQCNKITNTSERKKILAKKGLCFNCATRKHRAAECSSKASCQHCNKRHHSSICQHPRQSDGNGGKLMTDGGAGEGIFPVVVVKVNGVMCRALIDSGAGGSYASAKLVTMIDEKPSETKLQCIDMLMGSKTTRIEYYDTEISALDGNFKMNVKIAKVEKPELLNISNPGYAELRRKYSHLQDAVINDYDTKRELPIHLVLGNGEYARIKTSTKPLIGGECEPVAEKTKFGWFIMSPGIDFDRSTMLLTQTAHSDFENLCRLDVLGLADAAENDQSVVYEDFKEQLTRHPEGWYETNLPWKANHPRLPTNEAGSRRRLVSVIKKRTREGNYERYDDIMREQLDQGIIERAPVEASGKEHYLPHKGVVKQSAETTKLRIVFDASAKESSEQPSLNECLYPGPPLQNQLWNILVRIRIYPIPLTSDIEKAFLQIRIKEQERDSLRFFWKSPGSDVTTVYRFTRALFGMTCSPFLLGGVINEHLRRWESKYPNEVKEIRDGLYVDDLMTGGESVESVSTKREKAVEVFEDGSFKLHKWHSNVMDLEENTPKSAVNKPNEDSTNKRETKLLGLTWNKTKDTLTVETKQEPVTTKREALSELAKVYDPLGLVSPSTVVAKQLYREMCEAKLSWDGALTEQIKKRWEEWQLVASTTFTVPRSLAPFPQPVTAVTLHAFGDASKLGVSAAVYAVVEQENGTTQGLVCSKSRLAKKSLTIPRLELVAAHMAKNLVTNVERAIDTMKVVAVHCWSDSTVTLYWINGRGEYRQFVSNRVAKIKEQAHIQWHHVPTDGNPADLGSQGSACVDSELWRNGPDWLRHPSKWPPNIVPEPSQESSAEAKMSKYVFTTTNATPRVADELDELLEAHELRKVLMIGAWVRRFIENCRRKRLGDDLEQGPIKTVEIQIQLSWWIKRAQGDASDNNEIGKDEVKLNLQRNESGLLECRGRIEGEYPIYIPQNHPFAHKLVERAHLSTLHGGVGMTMAKIRENYWIPKLRRLVKRVRTRCWGCKRFRALSYEKPPPGKLPSTRTKGTTPFEVVGVDFAGPIRYKTKGKTFRKSYLVLYGCSLTRAVHLEVLRSLELLEFLSSLKRFIARRGRPSVIYSDNGTTFKAASKWLKRVQNDEQLNDFLSERSVQ